MDDDATLAGELIERHGWLAGTLAAEPMATIRPRVDPALVDRSTATAEGALAKLRAREAVVGGLALAGTLGQGGMGVVRLGTQESIGRKVAVKTTRPDRRSERNTVELLREAWVTGALEHPNVLPIYDLGLDAEGAPVIVMRLVEGTDWSELIHDAAAVLDRFGEDDLLEWNLRVLMQVCNALRLAHSRGIIHRDLKPENVMLGRFGEVYLVDWGIAVSLEPDPSGRFPQVDDRSGVVGTPAYLAPEMLLEQPERLSPRTDIYLLGALLHEMLTGAPPHRVENVEGYVDSVLRSSPSFAEAREAPAELVALCRRAMAARPEDRHADVESFRREVQAFLSHRASSRLAEEGAERLASLRTALASSEGSAEARDEQRAGLFSECRFAYEAALREWPQNPAARAGRREAIELLAAHELSTGNVRALRRLLAELDAPPDELVEGLAGLEAAAEAHREHLEQLEQLERDHDTRTGQRTRWFVIIVLGTIWTVTPFVIANSMSALPTHADVATVPAVSMILLAGFTVWARESLLATAFNRKIGATLFFTCVAQLALSLGHGFAGGDISMLLVLDFFLWFAASGFVSLTVEPRLWPVALGYLLAFVALCGARPLMDSAEAFMRFGLRVMSPSHLVLLVTVALIWKPDTIRRTRPPAPDPEPDSN